MASSLSSKTDNELMLRVKRGDLHLMGMLFKRHSQRMYAYFLRNTGSRSDAEDLLQTLFERMLRYRDTYRGDAKFTTWMYQVARNLRVDYFKDKSKTADREKAFVREFEDENRQESMTITDEQAIKKEILKKGMAQLTEDQREALVLGKYEGLKYSEIATILDCSEGAVKVRVYRAVKELKEICSKIAEELNYEL